MKKQFKIFFINFQLLDKYIIKINKVLWILGKNAFLFILIFILLDIILNGFLFYKYVFLVSIKEPQVVEIPTKFKESIYESVLKEMETRDVISRDLSE
mgnify:FL=1